MSQGLISFSTYVILNPGLTVPFIHITDGSNSVDITPTTVIHATGNTGPPGPPGPQGEIGPRGFVGNIGPIGYTGSTGPQGDAGTATLTGATGNTGPTGCTGPKGDDGIATSTGATGPTGTFFTPELGVGSAVIYNTFSSNFYYNSSLLFTNSTIESVAPLTVSRTIQNFSTIRDISGNYFEFDWSQNSVWTLSSLSTNFTANFVNLPSESNKSYVVLLNLLQSDYPFYTSTLQINSNDVPIRWPNGIVPTPTPNRVELESFTLFYFDGWISLGQYASFG